MVPLAEVYPAGTVNDNEVAQTVSLVITPGVTAGRGEMTSPKVAEAGAQIPLSATVIVNVMSPPATLSLPPKV